ncbi:MAG TPA: hypothetical protein VM434_15535 [Beijerinckiaceae bacterium]|nr:hypothetical protein [Beijerinckiaceae bacterium]
MRDLHNNVRILRSISPVAVGTTGTGKTGVAVDRAGYEAVEFEFSYGAITATNAVFTPTVLEGDTATGSFTSVADADLIGTEAEAGIAAGARTSGVNRNVTKRVGYRGVKRYVKAKIVSTVTAGTPVGANVLLGNPVHAPVANP